MTTLIYTNHLKHANTTKADYEALGRVLFGVLIPAGWLLSAQRPAALLGLAAAVDRRHA